MENFNFQVTTLNVRGMRNCKKRRKMIHWFSKHEASKGITFIQETHTTPECMQEWKNIFRGEIFMSHGSNNSKGVAVLIGEKLDHKIKEYIVDERGRYVIMSALIQGCEFVLINIYQPNEEKYQIETLKELFKKLNTLDIPMYTPIIWGGDFNVIFDTELDACGGNPSIKVKTIEVLDTIISEADLCDIWRIRNPLLKQYTWNGVAQGLATNKDKRLFRRLDYFFISDGLQPFVDSVKIIPAPSTDHSAVTIKLKSFEGGKRGPSFWKMNNSLLKEENYVNGINDLIDKVLLDTKIDNTTSAQSVWELAKYEIRKFSIKYSKKRAKDFRSRYAILEKQIMEIESKKDWNQKQDALQKHDTLKGELNKYSDYLTEGVILRSKSKWYEEGEKSTKYFLNLERRNKAKTCVRKVLNNNKEITDSSEILENIAKYYNNLYSLGSDLSEQECYQFLIDNVNVPQLKAEESGRCDGLLTMSECFIALKKMPNSKTPGNDGLTKEFYCKFWDKIGALVVDGFNESFEKGSLSTTQRQAVITLIEKPGKDSRYLKNWRPISLINVDAKICSKALSNRLAEILPSIIHSNQTAFVKDRNIDEPIRLIEDLMDYTLSGNHPLLLFAADFEKAFDSIHHNFIWAALKLFGFSENFVKWIRVLLNDTKSCVLNNGTASDFIDIKRGTKQGDPLSPYLFIIVIECMAAMIRQNDNIQGINFGAEDENKLKITLFADDTTFFLNNTQSLANTLEVLNIFQKFSGLKINREKSEIGWLGPKAKNQPTESEYQNLKWIDLHESGMKILGIHFSYNQSYYNTNNFERIFENFKTTLTIWRCRHLTPIGKIQVVKSLGLSKLTYVCTKLGAKDEFINRVKDEIIKFVWNGKKAKVKYNTLIGPYSNGGLKLPDFHSIIKASMCKWAVRLLDNTKRTWKIIPLQKLKKIGGIKCIRENFAVSRIPKDLPKFYSNVLKNWAELSYSEVESIQSILRQSLWNNTHIKFVCDVKYLECFLNCNICYVKDLWNPNTGFKWEDAKQKGLSDKEWFTWLGITRALPAPWRQVLKSNLHRYVDEITFQREIELSGKKCCLDKVKTKSIYENVISKKCEIPTSQQRWCRILHNNRCFDWNKAYSFVFATTRETKLKWFQYKIINNCLYLNKDLFKFKLTDNQFCSFGCKEIENIEHLFVTCKYSSKLYKEIQSWLKYFDINLPALNLTSIVIGPCSCFNFSLLDNFILLLYKSYVYRARTNKSMLEVKGFKAFFQYYEKIEHQIAMKNDSEQFHLTKYENIRKALYN